MKDYKWTKRLSQSTVANVIGCDPKSVIFHVNRRRRIVVCRVDNASGRGYGLALCSYLDEFDADKGRTIAANRAVLALTEHRNSRRIRNDGYQFPVTWTKKRIDHLKSFDGIPKCIYIPEGETSDYLEPLGVRCLQTT